MSLQRAILRVGLVVLLSSVSAGEDAPPQAIPIREQVRESIVRSLPYLEAEGVSWIENKKCVTCHRVAFLTWSHAQASRKGFAVDLVKNRERVEWSVQSSLEKKEKASDIDGALNIDGLAQILLGHSTDPSGALPEQQRATLVQIAVKGQQPDGSWKAGGQLPGQKRPKEETNQVSTMWIALALGSADNGEAALDARRRGRSWLERTESGKSTEWFVARLLLNHQERDSRNVASVIEQLKTQQNKDGGWGWLVGDPSDALGTGMALYALGSAGVVSGDPSIGRAQEFLVSTQLKDGSWAVMGTKASKKDRVEETASYWGAAWATLGLLQTLP
jgi:squalene-hopene cyclase-like protein